MPYRPVPFRSFGGGLNLQAQVDLLDEHQALDLLNVIFTERGSVRQRDGYAKLTSGEGTNRYDSLSPFYTAAGTKQLLAGAGNRLEAINTSGAVIASSTAPTASPHYFARFGSPTTEYLYIANGTDQIRRYDGSVFSAPVGLSTQTGRFLSVQTTDNRLVHARTATQPSRVLFSNEGAAETFTANDYVDLTPGDGEAIMGVCTWRELLLVFKESRFFVFYSNSQDGSGGTVFNYRPVDAGAGLIASRALCVAEEGVYFLGRRGIYRTTGSEPELLSDLVEPIFRGSPSLYFKSNTLNWSQVALCAMEVHDGLLYFAFPSGTATANDRLLVYDPRIRWWSLYDLPVADLTSFRVSSTPELLFAYSSGLKHIGRHKAGYAADNMATDGTGGTAITSRWRSGWFDYGSSEVKTIRELKLWGKGACRVSTYRDFKDSGTTAIPVSFGPASVDTWGDGTGPDTWDGGSGTDTWGPAGTIGPALVRHASRGTAFSVALTNDVLNQTWALHRFESHIREARPPTVIQTEVSA